MARGSTGVMESKTGGAESDRLQEAASGLADQAARTAEAQASTTMTRAGDTLDQVARAIRDAGNGMRDDQPQIAGIADTAAQRVEEASRYLRDHQAGEVVDNLQSWAREQPAMVIGGGLAIGLLLGRFLKSGSSSQGNEWQSGSGRYGPAGGRSYAGGHGGYAGEYGAGYGGSPSGYAGASAAGIGGSAAALGGGGYETSSAGYAGGTGYDTGTLAGDAIGTGSSTGAGSLGGLSTGSPLDNTQSGYASGIGEARDTTGHGSDDLSDELAATDAAATETQDVAGEQGVSAGRATRRRR